ncbi:MAG TPA: hypothetical protein VJH23_03775 [archaeon]|nr:hypothetical protein [archaeon]
MRMRLFPRKGPLSPAETVVHPHIEPAKPPADLAALKEAKNRALRALRAADERPEAELEPLRKNYAAAVDAHQRLIAANNRNKKMQMQKPESPA